jgi:membrane protease subunit (stomatin/prohibitin family)
MGLFDKNRTDGKTFDGTNNERKGIIDRIKYDGDPNELVWKFPYDNLSIGAQLIVNESQEAIFYKGGQALDTFGPGTHTLSASNIPLLQKLVNLPFGGKTPFTAEVWYINKTVKRDLKWGTKDPIRIQDPNYKIIIPVRAYGEVGIVISDARNFMTQIIGTMHTADILTISKNFSSLIVTKTKDTIASFIVKKRTSVLEIPAMIDELSELCKERFTSEFEKYGLQVTNFYIESINYPDDDSSVIQLQSALAKKAEMDIIGYNYQQERTFDTLETAAGNEGNSGNMMGAGMGLGMGVGVGGAFGNAMSNMGNQINPQNQVMKCPSCSATIQSNLKFCSECGFKLVQNKVKCYKCNTENNEDAKFCNSCGANLKEIKCPKCGKEYNQPTKFCNECGEKM